MCIYYLAYYVGVEASRAPKVDYHNGAFGGVVGWRRKKKKKSDASVAETPS